jgi:sialidase-1
MRPEASGWLVVEAVGSIGDGDLAYPQAVVLDDGEVLCSFGTGGNLALGGTDWARSTDGGRTWRIEGTILPRTTDPPTTNFLKLSRSPDTGSVFAYGARLGQAEARFGSRPTEAVLCISNDRGHTWSDPRVVPLPGDRLEITHGVLGLSGGRLLAPAATVGPGRPGERVLTAVSVDGGTSWDGLVEVLRDPAGERGYLEHKLADLGDGTLLATAWTVRMADVTDLPNSYAVSHDSGATWSAPMETTIHGQTMSTVPLESGWLLALYNRRTVRPGVVAALVSLDADRWTTHDEALVHAAPDPDRPGAGGTEGFNAFGFGFPTGVRLADGAILVTFWTRDGQGPCSVRWARLRVQLPPAV